MQLSVDLFNGLFLFAIKALLLLALVHWLVEQSRDWSASIAHSLLVIAAVAVLMIPLLSLYLPSLSLALIPQAMGQWLTIPVVGQGEGKLAYNGPLLLLTFVYLMAVASLLIYMILGIMQVAQTSRRSRPAPASVQQLGALVADQLQLTRRPRIKVSDEVSLPQVWGAIDPVVLLPASHNEWPESRLRRVLIHELAHLKRHDWLLKMLLHTLAALLWFVPLIWSTVRRSAWYAELACDDWVVSLEGSRAEYADDLLTLSVAGGPTPMGAVALINSPRVYQRIRAVLDGSRSRDPVSWPQFAKHVLMGLALLVPLASVSAVVRPPVDDGADPVNRWHLIRLDSAPAKPDEEPKPDDNAFSPEYLRHLKEIAPPPAGPEELISISSTGDVDPKQRMEQIAILSNINIESRIDMRETVSLVTMLPRYPARALQQGIEGYVTVQFDVDMEGNVVNPRVVSARPDTIFNRTVIDAVSQFRFRPQRINGQTIITKNVTETFVFKIAAE